MLLSHLSLQNFRNYTKASFDFNKQTTLVVGPNTSGKSNFIEALVMLSGGKSFRAEKDTDMIAFNQEVGRVCAEVQKGLEEIERLEVVLSTGILEGKSPSKRFLLNKVPKRRIDFAGILPLVLFSPEDLDILTGPPGVRRNFLDDVLEQTDRDYRIAATEYSKGLRQRNALLEQVRETGVRNQKVFEYWDNLLIKNGSCITQKRKEFLEYVNLSRKDIFDFVSEYDASIISEERLLKYKEAEERSGVTLVGPHRDEVIFYMNDRSLTTRDVKVFGSRGQKRLAILQLKLLQLSYIEKILGERPMLLLDDIFS